MKRIATGMLLFALAAAQGCASAEVSPERLAITAATAAQEARTAAVSWSPLAELKWVEGEGVRSSGRVAPGGGLWRFIYESPRRTDQLVVTVTPRTMEQETRPPQGPPGFVLGGARLAVDWIDSPQALAAVTQAAGADVFAGEDVALSMLLLPLRPPQWIIRAAADGGVRQWRVNAETGRVLE